MINMLNLICPLKAIQLIYAGIVFLKTLSCESFPDRNFYYLYSSDVLTADAGGFKFYATSVTTALVKNFNAGKMIGTI